MPRRVGLFKRKRGRIEPAETPRHRRAGATGAALTRTPEHALNARLDRRLDSAAHSHYNSLIRASHILHGESPDQVAALIQRAAAALTPDGKIVVHEFILEDDRSGPLYPALFSLNMPLGTAQGQSYSRGEISRFLEEAGLTRVS